MPPSTAELFRSLCQTESPRHWALELWRYAVATLVLLILLLWGVANRLALYIDDILFPNYKSVEVNSPLFVVGPPRSGTTLLHRLIALDQDQFTTFPLWEILFAPAIWQKKIWLGLNRIDSFFGHPIHHSTTAVMNFCCRSLNGVHPTSLDAPEEDYLLLLPQRTCFLLVLVFPHCDSLWQIANLDHDVSPSQRARLMQQYRRLVQRHLYVRGSHRFYLSKNPTFTGWVNSLSEEFPNARFAILLRKPQETLPSQLSSIRGAMSLAGHDVTSPEIVQRFTNLFLKYYSSCELYSREFKQKQAMLIPYCELKQEPAESIQNLLSTLGYSLHSEFLKALQVSACQSRDYRSKHQYSLAEFHLTEQQIETQFFFFDGMPEQVEQLAHQGLNKENGDVSSRCSASM